MLKLFKEELVKGFEQDREIYLKRLTSGVVSTYEDYREVRGTINGIDRCIQKINKDYEKLLTGDTNGNNSRRLIERLN